MRRACSRDVRSVSSLRSDPPEAYPRHPVVPHGRTARAGRSPPPPPEARGRRSAPLPPRGPESPSRRRGTGSISKSATRSGRSRRARTASSAGAVDSRAGRDPEACELQDALRLLPGEEVGELVRADEEDRIVEVERFERVHRPRERVERDLGHAERIECQLREEQAQPGRRADLLVPGILDDTHEQPVELERRDSSAGERDVAVVWRIERPPEHADAHGCHSSSSSPISTRVPGRTPAPRSASSSSSPSGASPTTRNPRSVRSTLNARRGGGSGR